MKILLVDDSPTALAIARARLAKERLEIITADGGRACLELAHGQRPDLILLDLDMPDLSGFETCRALKGDPELCMIPVIFLTGSGDTGDKVRGLDMGAVDYVTKPFDAFELRARVRAALRNKRLQDLLIKHAQIDPLTELWNRRALMERLQQEWARIHRHGGCVSCVMADVDRFKNVNDQYGHNVGDEVLRHVARVLTSQCREADLAARYGGEEFIILVPEEDAEGAGFLAERCRREIEKMTVESGDHLITVTASFGVADSFECKDGQEMIDHADAALYRAKQNGRNQVQMPQPQKATS